MTGRTSDAAASGAYISMFCNDAGWICGVLCITDAENLQRDRELLRGKFARSRRSRRCTRIFCVAKRCTDSSENTSLLQARLFGSRQEFCAAHARETRENFATNSPIFGFSCAENLRDLGAEREFLCRQMLHRLKRELCRRQDFYTACAREMQSRLSRAASRNYKKNSATNSSFDDAHFARARRQTRKFSSQNAPSDAAASSVYISTFYNDAGLICGVLLRIKDAKNCNEFGNFCAENLHDLGGVGVARNFLRCQTLH